MKHNLKIELEVVNIGGNCLIFTVFTNLNNLLDTEEINVKDFKDKIQDAGKLDFVYN